MVRKVLLGSSLAALAMLTSEVARAEWEDSPAGTQPVSYSARPLTLPALALSPRLDTIVGKLSTTTAAKLYATDPKLLDLNFALGASFGATENIEVGAVVVPLQVLHGARYGNPSIHGTFRFLKGGFELGGFIGTTFVTHAGIDPQLILPVVTSSAGVVFNPGLVSRIHMGTRSKLDISAILPIQLGSSVHDLGLNIPVELAINFIESMHIGITSGFGIADVKAPALNSYVPLGFIAGGAISANDKPVVDIGALFRWPQFANPGQNDKNPGQSSTIDTKDYQVGLSIAVYVYLM